MFRHMAILKFKADAQEKAIQAFLAQFPGVMDSIPEVKRWSIGRNVGGGGESHVKTGGYPPNYDVGLVMDFDSPEAYRAYAECATHQKFFAQYLKSILAERVVVQFHTK
jgi:hypothetical protein